jgi:hypothetical protein
LILFLINLDAQPCIYHTSPVQKHIILSLCELLSSFGEVMSSIMGIKHMVFLYFQLLN